MISEIDKRIGERLQQARKGAGYRSARAFARAQSMPESTYSQHETGKRSLNPEMVIYYSQCFNVDPGWLVSGREPGIDVKQLRERLTVAIQKLMPDYQVHLDAILNYCVNNTKE